MAPALLAISGGREVVAAAPAGLTGTGRAVWLVGGLNGRGEGAGPLLVQGQAVGDGLLHDLNRQDRQQEARQHAQAVAPAAGLHARAAAPRQLVPLQQQLAWRGQALQEARREA